MAKTKPTDILNKVLEVPYTEEAPPSINVEEFRKVVTTRRSVRVFDNTPIPEEIVRDCIDLALLSPNSSNLQPWEFYWVRSEKPKAELVKACLSQPAAKTAGELIVCVARTDTWKENAKEMLRLIAESSASGPTVPDAITAYYKKLVPFVYGQGPLNSWGWIKRILFFFRGLFVPTPREPVSASDMATWSNKTVALAAQTLMLALRAYGYDSCPMEGMDSDRVRKILKLPKSAKICMVIGAGKRAKGGIYGPRVRFDKTRFVKEV